MSAENQEDKGAEPEVTAGPTEEAGAAETGAGSGDKPQTAAAEGVFKRRPVWKACLDAYTYVSSISQDEGVKVRDSDRATSIALLITSLAAVGGMVYEPLAPHRMALILSCDALIGLSIFYYIGNRFGIIGTFNPRQALLAWQLMMGATFFGVFLAINLALLLGLIVVTGTPAELPTG